MYVRSLPTLRNPSDDKHICSGTSISLRSTLLLVAKNDLVISLGNFVSSRDIHEAYLWQDSRTSEEETESSLIAKVDISLWLCLTECSQLTLCANHQQVDGLIYSQMNSEFRQLPRTQPNRCCEPVEKR